MMKAEEYLEDGLARIFKPRARRLRLTQPLVHLTNCSRKPAMQRMICPLSSRCLARSLESVLQAAQTRQHELDAEIDCLQQPAFWQFSYFRSAVV